MAFCAVIAPIQPLARSYKDFLGLAPSGRRASLALAPLPRGGLRGLRLALAFSVRIAKRNSKTVYYLV